jgi:uncharacterized protein YhaN
MSRKDAYQKKLEAQLDEWKAEIEMLKAKAGTATAGARLEYEKALAELRERREMAKKKLDELRRASDDAWEDLKDGVEDAWKAVGDAMKKLRSKLK